MISIDTMKPTDYLIIMLSFFALKPEVQVTLIEDLYETSYFHLYEGDLETKHELQVISHVLKSYCSVDSDNFDKKRVDVNYIYYVYLLIELIISSINYGDNLSNEYGWGKDSLIVFKPWDVLRMMILDHFDNCLVLNLSKSDLKKIIYGE